MTPPAKRASNLSNVSGFLFAGRPPQRSQRLPRPLLRASASHSVASNPPSKKSTHIRKNKPRPLARHPAARQPRRTNPNSIHDHPRHPS